MALINKVDVVHLSMPVFCVFSPDAETDRDSSGVVSTAQSTLEILRTTPRTARTGTLPGVEV